MGSERLLGFDPAVGAVCGAAGRLHRHLDALLPAEQTPRFGQVHALDAQRAGAAAHASVALRVPGTAISPPAPIFVSGQQIKATPRGPSRRLKHQTNLPTSAAEVVVGDWSRQGRSQRPLQLLPSPSSVARREAWLVEVRQGLVGVVRGVALQRRKGPHRRVQQYRDAVRRRARRYACVHHVLDGQSYVVNGSLLAATRHPTRAPVSLTRKVTCAFKRGSAGVCPDGHNETREEAEEALASGAVR